MKRILSILILSGVLLLASNQLHAQRADDSALRNPLWYGGGFTLGFQGGTFSSLFNFGVSPMVGYRLFDEFSVGTRVSLLYTIYTEKNTGGPNESISPISWEVGVFSRYKFNGAPIFAHVELSVENQAFPIRNNGELATGRVELGNTYIGGGYTSGGRIAYEILALYNVNQRDVFIANSNPIEFRIGFTVNF